KKSLRESGFCRGCTCMSMRQAERSATVASRSPNVRKSQAACGRGIPPLRKERARVGHPTFVEGTEIWRRCGILAGHLRDGAWFEALQKAACARRIVLGIGRKHDQEEAVFG